jgi:HEAT repeat-containing protein 5
MELLQKDIVSLPNPSAPPEIVPRSLGHAYGLAALFAVIPERPLYISYDLATKALDMAIQLLKRASDHDIKIADCEMEVAWICISSLMALGPNFVKSHLPQLLVLWRNALPKPTSKDTSNGRSVAEWMFLLHVRECALGAIFSFLRHNAPTIVSLDVTRRLTSLLSNAVGFANSFVSVKPSLDISDAMSEVGGKGVTPTSREASLRRRAYDCFSLLGISTLTDSAQTTLLQSAISLFGSHEGYAGSAAQAAIASSSGNLPNVWQAADGYGYGVTSLRNKGQQAGLTSDNLSLDADSVESAFEKLVSFVLICQYIV